MQVHVILLDDEVATGVLLEPGTPEEEAFRADLTARYGRRVRVVSLGHIDTAAEAAQRLVDLDMDAS